MNKKSIFLTLITIAIVRCESESSELFRQDLVSLIPPITEVVHSVDDSRMITCTGIDMKWKNPYGKYLRLKEGRVHIEDSSSPSDEIHSLRLVFQKIEKVDSGTWTCEGTYGRKSFEMIIYERISFRNYPQEFEASENFTTTIRCAAEGQPKPFIHWFKNGNPIEESIHIKKVHDGLWIDRVNRSHAGKYLCKAIQNTSQAIESKDRVIQLDVQYKPQITLSDRMMALNGNTKDASGTTIKYGFINGTVELICEATGNPTPNISWVHHNRRISHQDVSHFNGTALLTIHLHFNESFGAYKCVAKNEIGHDEYNIILEKAKRPSMPEKFSLRGHGYDSLDIDLGFTEESEENPWRILKYRFEMMLKDAFENNGGHWKYQNIRDMPAAATANSSYIISNLQSNTTYLMRVASISAAGLSEWTDMKEFQTLAFLPTKSPNNSFKIEVPVCLLFVTIIFNCALLNIH